MKTLLLSCFFIIPNLAFAVSNWECKYQSLEKVKGKQETIIGYITIKDQGKLFLTHEASIAKPNDFYEYFEDGTKEDELYNWGSSPESDPQSYTLYNGDDHIKNIKEIKACSWSGRVLHIQNFSHQPKLSIYKDANCNGERVSQVAEELEIQCRYEAGGE